MIEEAYEVVAVLDSGDYRRLPEELGDLLFQVLLHTQLAEESGDFDMSAVLSGLSAKLVRRHPHVFGDVKLETSSEVIDQWDELKKAERAQDDSALANVPAAMPALAYAQTLLRRAEVAGFAWPNRDDVLEKLHEELEELAAAPTPEAQRRSLATSCSTSPTTRATSASTPKKRCGTPATSSAAASRRSRLEHGSRASR